MKPIIIISLLSFSLGFILAILVMQYSCDSRNNQIIYERDTLYKSIPSEPLILEKVKTKIIYTKDTIIKSMPFLASIDTIIKYDTIHAEYEFPKNLFSLKILEKPDTLKTIYINTNTSNKINNYWWEKPAYFIGGTILGYFVGKSNY